MTNDKKVKVHFTNPEGGIELKIKGKNAVAQSIKIMKAFDEACKEIREGTDK